MILDSVLLFGLLTCTQPAFDFLSLTSATDPSLQLELESGTICRQT